MTTYGGKKMQIPKETQGKIEDWLGITWPKDLPKITSDYSECRFADPKAKIKNKKDYALSLKGKGIQAFNHKTQQNKFFQCADLDIKETYKYKPQPVKNCEAEFKTLSNENINKHPYTVKKKISLKNVRIKNDNLIIPIYESKPVYKDKKIISWETTIVSWQSINPQGAKKFKKGNKLPKGHCFPIGKLKDKIYVCEGVGTGASVNNITGELTLCAFSKGNLDNVANMALKKYPKHEVIMCLDNDGENTHETKITNKRVITLCPDEIDTDFNDCQRKQQEINKLLFLDHFIKPIKATVEKTEYLDEPNCMILKNHLIIVSGNKESLKSTGLLSYLCKFNLRIGYFSDCEVDEELLEKRKRALEMGDEKIQWIKLDREDTWKNIDKIIKANRLDIIVEDPPMEKSEFWKIDEVRKELGKRMAIAKRNKITWALVRNYSKVKELDPLKRISGFAVWTNMPRATIIFYPIEAGHAEREILTHDSSGDPIPEDFRKPLKASLMHLQACNEGPKPRSSMVLKLEIKEIQEDIKGARIDVAVCSVKTVERPDNPEKWCQVETQASKDRKGTEEFIALSYIKDKGKNGISSYDFKKKLMDKNGLGFPSAKVGRFIRRFKDLKYISGGGSGKGTKNFKLDKEGQKILDKDS